MQHYNRPKVRNIIESLATVYGIPVDRWFLTFGTAMVVHGLNTSTGDVDVTLGQEDWANFSQYHDVNTDTLGPIIELPGKIEVRPMLTLMTEHNFIRQHGVMVGDLRSLHQAYTWFQENPVTGRNKEGSDLNNINKLVMRINQDKQGIATEIEQGVNSVLQDAIAMVVELGSSKLFEKMGEDVYRTTVKDNNNSRWGVKVYPKAQSLEFWEISEVDMHSNVEKHVIKLSTSVGKAR